MKFTTSAAALRSALEAATKVVPRSPSQIVYSGVRLRVHDGVLTVTGSDEGQTTVTTTLEPGEATDGDKVMQPKPLLAYLATVRPTASVSVHTANGPELTVQVEGARPYTFRLMEATFPNTNVPTDQVHNLDWSDLAAAVKAVKACGAQSGLVQVVSDTHGVALNSTDGLRVTRAHLPQVTFGQFAGLLPISVLEQLGDLNPTRVALDRRGRVFTAGNATVLVVTRLAEDVFPDVRPIVEDTPPHQTRVPKKEFLAALARLATVCDHTPVQVVLAGDQMVLSATSVAVGSGAEPVELDEPVTNEVTFWMNLEFLRDAVQAAGLTHVYLRWGHPERPVFITADDPLHVTTVVMPVRISS